MRRHVFASIVFCGILSTALGAEFDLSWHSIDAGSVVRSTGGVFELSATIGQPDAGVLAAGTFELTGGFWFKVPPTDCDEDGVVSLTDYSSFAQCLLGPVSGSVIGCECFDVNQSGTIDLKDFAAAQIAFSAP